MSTSKNRERCGERVWTDPQRGSDVGTGHRVGEAPQRRRPRGCSVAGLHKCQVLRQNSPVLREAVCKLVHLCLLTKDSTFCA